MERNIGEWVSELEKSLAAGTGTEDLFTPTALWRDYLAFGWTLQTIEGQSAIADFVSDCGPVTASSGWAVDGDAGASEGFVSFETAGGRASGYVRLQDGQCFTLFTALQSLKGHEEPLKANRRSGIVADPQGRNWTERRKAELDGFNARNSPYVVIIGGGQGGLALGARLEMLGVPYLIIDKQPRVGDQWRSRYKSLTLHDPVWYDHMPYMPFPDFWPVYTPKDKMGDWLEFYADALELNICNSTECTHAKYDADAGKWNIQLIRGGETLDLSPEHLIMAVGNAGVPRVPDIPGQDSFQGAQMHSSAFSGNEDLNGKRVVVVGANNSAHDIAATLVENGAEPIMIQRSSTLIIRQSNLSDLLLKPLYSEDAVMAGMTTDKADIFVASMPMRMQEQLNQQTWIGIRALEAEFYKKLTDAGFKLDFGEDGTGLSMKYQRTASGYYIDVGACDMIIDGRIGLRSGVNIEQITQDGVQLDSGETLPADMVVYATGFGSMEEWVARIIDQETAQKVGNCWGYGSGFKGDPGPWEGEIRNMWKPTAQEGLWFMGGNLAQARFYSKYLGLQLKARYENLPVKTYQKTS